MVRDVAKPGDFVVCLGAGNHHAMGLCAAGRIEGAGLADDDLYRAAPSGF